MIAMLIALGACRLSAESAGGVLDLRDASPDVALSINDSGADAAPGGGAGGDPCERDGNCASNFCVEGVCCNSACTGSCMTCSVAANSGHCQPAAAGSDPRNDCSDEGASTCGHDGFCDGAGQCRRYQVGTTCGAASCTGSSLAAAGACDGAGTCVVMPGQSCAPYACAANATCRSNCTGDTDCSAPSTCQAGSCGLKAVGTACVTGVECASGVCAQGLCCNAACDGVCHSCALAGSRGMCAIIPTGQEAQGTCAAPAICSGGFCGGLRGEYFRTMNLAAADRVLVRTDAVVNFDWGQGSPDPAVPVDGFSVRWTGTVTPRFTETYTFYTFADDGTRLWIDGQPLIDDWTQHAARQDQGMTIALQAGVPVSLKLEYFDQAMAASVQLRWSSTSEPKAIIPTSALAPQ